MIVSHVDFELSTFSLPLSLPISLGHVQLTYFCSWSDVEESCDKEAVTNMYCAPGETYSHMQRTPYFSDFSFVFII